MLIYVALCACSSAAMFHVGCSTNCQVIAASAQSVTISWPSSIEHKTPAATRNNNHDDVCSLCRDDLSILQYASGAYSPATANTTLEYGAAQAVGPPDVPHCKASPLAWLAYDSSNNMAEDAEAIALNQLYIELYFKEPVLTNR